MPRRDPRFASLTAKGLTMSRSRYGLINFALDAILCLLTGGLWLIWIFVREMRNR